MQAFILKHIVFSAFLFNFFVILTLYNLSWECKGCILVSATKKTNLWEHIFQVLLLLMLLVKSYDVLLTSYT